jgi:hypothetical protein
MSVHFRTSSLVASSALVTLVVSLTSSGCGGGGGGGPLPPAGGGGGGGGGAPAGTGASGGSTVGTGGAPTGTGGASGAGGLPGATGGAPSSTGGAPNGTGGVSSGTGGGPSGTGGAPTGTGGGGPSTGLDDYNPDFKEFTGEDCTLPDPAVLSPASHELPDPFLMPDGSRMSSKEQWACQRAWLKKSIEAHVHGTKPGTPDSVTGTVSNSSIAINVSHGGANTSFSIPISLPPGANGPVPGMFQAPATGVPGSFLDAEGVAEMPYDHADLEAAYNAIYGSGDVSVQIKWAWGVSRAIDVLVAQEAAGQNEIIDPRALGTTGCSFAGKSAFTVGAFDERIALGIPMESGTGGLASYRIVADNDIAPNDGENNPEQLSEVCDSDNWLRGTVCSNADGTPADAHFMVAMYAPRGFTTLENNRIGHLAPVAGFTATAAGAEVFKALGIESHVGYHGGNDGDPHNHCSFNASQMDTAQKAIRGFLTKTQPPANFMEPKLKDANDQPVDWDLAEYIDWTTPTLD